MAFGCYTVVIYTSRINFLFVKAIKATARRLKINTNLLWLFLLFGRLDNFSIFHGI